LADEGEPVICDSTGTDEGVGEELDSEGAIPPRFQVFGILVLAALPSCLGLVDDRVRFHHEDFELLLLLSFSSSTTLPIAPKPRSFSALDAGWGESATMVIVLLLRGNDAVVVGVRGVVSTSISSVGSPGSSSS
jgi:hypothetical protein